MAAQPGMHVVNSYGGMGGSMLSKEQLEQLEAYYGFDKPIFVSYVSWLSKVVTTRPRHVDALFGAGLGHHQEPLSDLDFLRRRNADTHLRRLHSARYRQSDPPQDAVRQRQFGVGVLRLRDSRICRRDRAAHGVRVRRWTGFPSVDSSATISTICRRTSRSGTSINHAVLPVLSYVAGSFAVTTLLMKNSLMDNLAADYVRTAIAKGMTFRRAVFRHAFRNSLVPIATSFGGNISLILTGSFLIEKIFDIDGFGLLGLRIAGRTRLPGRDGHPGDFVAAVHARQHSLRPLRRARRSARQVRQRRSAMA